ncbi:MAG: ATP-binding protein, partial [Nitrospirota bacterium]
DKKGLLVRQAGFAKCATDRVYTNQTFNIGEGIAGIVAKTNRPIMISNSEEDERFLRLPVSVKVKSLLSLPISSNGKAIGVLNLSHPKKAFFNESHERVFTILATMAGGFIRFADLKNELEDLNGELEKRVIERTEEINRSYEYLKNLIENANDIVFTLDRSGRFTFFNQRIEEFGYKRDELIGAHISSIFRETEGKTSAAGRTMERFNSFLSIFAEDEDAGAGDDAHGDNYRERRKGLEKKASTLTEMINFLYHTKHSYELILDGKERRFRDLLCSFSPLVDANGIFSGILGIARDITERKKMEERLARSEKLGALGFLISGIAHELNNKLVPILGYSELFERSFSNKRNLHMIKAISRSAIGAKYIVESLLRFSKQEKPQKTYLNLNNVMREACSILRYSLGPFISLKLDLDPNLPMTLADEHQMEQVFMNILNNACQAMNEKGGVLIVRSCKSGKHIIFEISDTGPGIPDENINKIFDPFFTDKTTGAGTGLGLSICHGIINEHMGDISVRSNPDDTTFTIRLPFTDNHDDNCVSEKKPGKKVKRDIKRKRILIIDDEVLQLELLEHTLSKDYDVFRADSSRKAIGIVKKEELDLILCDIKMPGMDGMEFYEWLVKNRPGTEKKFLIVTGNIMEERIKCFMKIAGDRVITKPYRIGELTNKIEEYISGSA